MTAVLTVTVRATVLERSVLFEIEPDSPKGTTFIIPLAELVGVEDGDEWKMGAK